MAKNKVSEWSSTPANNTDIGGINIAEGCAPSGINNAIREMMAQVKDMQSGTDADNFTVGGNLTVTGTATGVTPLSSDNSTKFATTAYVQAITGSLGTASQQNVGLSSGNVVQRDAASSVPIGSTWSVKEVGGVLFFSVSGTNKAKLDSSGNLTVSGNVTAYGTV